MTQRTAPLWTICIRPFWTLPVIDNFVPRGTSPRLVKLLLELVRTISAVVA